MELTPGTKLGPYQIVSPIGAGGMGEVFKARDTRLDRTVAVKVMPKHIAAREDLRARFEREARTVSKLNHPNICVLFDIGRQDGTDFMVLEYLEGETLAARIAKGPLPLDQALKFAMQIADALDRAHRNGVVHRDVKPANIMITREGVKVLDFGLAKSAVGKARVDDATMTIALTEEGAVVGTPQYMAPELYTGVEADVHADIFGFGCVLYEMVTGKRAFDGKTRASVVASIIGAEPQPMSSLVAVTPAALERVVKGCLIKDPEERYQSLWDVLIDLRGIAENGAESSAQSGGVAHGTPRTKLWAAAALVLAVATGFTLLALWRETRPADHPLVRLDVDLGADVSLSRLTASSGTTVAISPDGTRLAYVSGTPPKLFTRRLDQSKATELTPGQAPFFSSDSQWIGFSGSGELNKISVEGGAVVPVAADLGIFSAGSWGEDGSIYVGLRGKGVVRIRADGGEPETVAAPGQGEVALAFPQILPGGKALLFSAYTAPNPGASSIEVMTLADHHRKTVSRGGTSPRYLATPNGAGYLIYLNKATLFAIPFDLDKLETRGNAIPILDDVASGGVLGTAQLSVARSGTLVYRRGSGEDAELLTVAWLDGAGKTQPLLAKPGAYGRPSLSPDGQQVALEVTDGSGTDIWVYDWQRDTMTRLTFTGKASVAVWTPDGRYIVFTAAGEGISVTRADGAGKAQFLIQSKNIQHPWSFTPDGRRMAFQELDSTSKWHLWTVPVESDGAGLRAGKPEVFLQTPAAGYHPVFSPDGRWLAYGSGESGTGQIYVRAFPDKGGKWQISNSGGGYPMWSRTGHELFFETLDNRLMVAAYTVKGDSLVADKPRVWSDKPLGGVNGVKNLDLAGDGKRIAALMPATEAKGTQVAQNHVVFLENFLDELLRKAPAGK